jgi:membrane protease YdiL (CAAX protease family)
MTTLRAFVTRHAVLTYFALTFAISWGGVLLVIGGPGGFTGTMAQANPLFPFAVMAMVAGPSVAGILLTGIVRGRAGLREFRSRLFKWRVEPRWYAVALLAAPATAATVFLALSLFSPQFLPAVFVTEQRAGLVLLGLAVAFGAGVFEELGWTGFAIPELRRSYGVVRTGLIVGLLWSAWHLLVAVWGIGDRAGTIPLALYVLLDTFSALPAFRVLMVWVYDRTESLLVGILMHVSITASTLILWPVTKGAPLLMADFAFAAAVWIVIAVIVLASSQHRSAHPLRGATAMGHRA